MNNKKLAKKIIEELSNSIKRDYIAQYYVAQLSKAVKEGIRKKQNKK